MTLGSLLATGLSAAAAISDLGSAPAVTIGGVALSGLEVPAKMPWGGEQRLVVHKLPGGGRVVDALGRDDRDVEWSGFFTGPSAVSRAEALDAMRIAGRPVVLTWAGFRRNVVLKTFECDYASGGALLPYRVCCVVVTVGPTVQTPTLLGAVSSDLASAVASTGLPAAATSALTAAQAALPIGAVLSKGSPAFLSLSAATAQASTALSVASAGAEAQLAGVAANGSKAGTVFANLSDLVTASSAQAQLAAATGAAGFAGRAGKSLAA